ncbi:MAG: hypothetical protein LBQ88_19295, partial [Treponema sp.]|nr:hypothetical protein [Treponema sp.]
MHKKQNLDSLNAFCIDKARYMEHSNIPNFGLSGKNDFTLETIILFQNNSVKSDIYAQAGVFSFGIDQGQIYFEAPGFCSLKTSINQLHLNEQSIYSISLRYNKTDKKVSLFFQGYLIDEIETKPDGTEAAGNYQMGCQAEGGSIGGIVSIHTFSESLDEKQILKDSMRGTQEVPDSCVSWFDFQETNIADKSKNGL